MKAIAFVLLLCVTCEAHADGPAATGSGPDEPVSIEHFTEPVLEHLATLTCMDETISAECDPIIRGHEGWVELNLMDDVTGKPFEVTVTRSSGSENFKRAALKAMEASTFTPGTVNGKAVESDTELKKTFANGSPSVGASKALAFRYHDLLQALKAHDREKADAALKSMQVQDLTRMRMPAWQVIFMSCSGGMRLSDWPG